MCLIKYNSFAKHEMQQYRMVKCKVVLPKCLLHVATQIEKDRYTLIEQSAHLVLLKIGIYSYLIISLAIAVLDEYNVVE